MNYESRTNGRIRAMSRGHSAKGKGERNIGKGAEQKMKIILVDKEERERAEKEIWHKITKPETEVCYIFEKEKGEFWVR